MIEQTIARLKEVRNAEELKSLLQDIQCDVKSDSAPSFTIIDCERVLQNTAGACHICSGKIESTQEVEIDWFGSLEQSLAAHKGCFEVRSNESPSVIAVAIKVGFWVMMRVQMEECKSWIYNFMDHWIDEYGHGIGALVHAPNVDGWNENASISSREELLAFTRRLYVYEREAPKFTNQGFTVPDWDPSIGWKYWKKHLHKPIYEQLTRLKDRKTLLKDRLVLSRTNGVCALCGGFINQSSEVRGCRLAKDHIFPFCKGGTDYIENLQPLHRFCNAAISSVGVGEIPLSLQMGHWLIDNCKNENGIWIDDFLKTYSSHLRSARNAVIRRRSMKINKP
jgi:5-methylcytosine-specific restriction endonuclease McrA